MVIPVFNASRYLAEAIDSVLGQSFQEWELVAVDDGSSDDSLSILERYSLVDFRVRVIAMPHAGIVSTRNTAIDAARGKFIAALDNDDAMLPQRLERQVEFLRNYPTIVAVGGGGILVDADGDPLINRVFPTSSEEVESELLAGRNPLMQSCMMFRRDAMLQAGGYQDGRSFAEDYDLFLRLTEIGGIANLNEVLIRQRQHISRASASHYGDQNRVAIQALRDAYQRRNLRRELPVIEGSWHPSTLRDYHVRCASDAWDGGNTATVRKHARAMIAESGFSLRGIELYSRTLMGRTVYKYFAIAKALLKPFKTDFHLSNPTSR